MRIGVLIAATLLSGCSAQSTYGQYFALIRQSVAHSFSDRSVTREQAAAIPYASIGYRIDGEAERLLVLATETAGTQLWTASNHVVLSTRGGRVIRTVGLPHNLSDATPLHTKDWPQLSEALIHAYTSLRSLDFSDIETYSVTLTCVTQSRGPQPVTILGATFATVRIDETCSSEKPRWLFTDSYWIEPRSGLVRRARQHIHPQGEVLETRILRPAN